MNIDIPKNVTPKEIKEIMGRINQPKRFNAKKFAGKLTWGQDAVAFQRELRDDA